MVFEMQNEKGARGGQVPCVRYRTANASSRHLGVTPGVLIATEGDNGEIRARW